MRWQNFDDEIELRNHNLSIWFHIFVLSNDLNILKTIFERSNKSNQKNMRRLGPTSSSSTFNNHKNRLCRIADTSAYAKCNFIFWKRTWESFHQKRSETGSSTTTERVEDQETLETGTIVREFSDSVKDIVNELFANSIVTSSIVVGSILFARNQLLWMEELFVWSRSYWISSLKIVRSYHIDRQKNDVPESITDGSKSTKTALGTWRPEPVDEKKVENESSVAETESAPMVPSGLIPCSIQ